MKEEEYRKLCIKMWDFLFKYRIQDKISAAKAVHSKTPICLCWACQYVHDIYNINCFDFEGECKKYCFIKWGSKDNYCLCIDSVYYQWTTLNVPTSIVLNTIKRTWII